MTERRDDDCLTVEELRQVIRSELQRAVNDALSELMALELACAPDFPAWFDRAINRGGAYNEVVEGGGKVALAALLRALGRQLAAEITEGGEIDDDDQADA